MAAENAMRTHLVNARNLLLPPSDLDEKFEELVRSSLAFHDDE
jgi:hypothetical protein